MRQYSVLKRRAYVSIFVLAESMLCSGRSRCSLLRHLPQIDVPERSSQALGSLTPGLCYLDASGAKSDLKMKTDAVTNFSGCSVAVAPLRPARSAAAAIIHDGGRFDRQRHLRLNGIDVRPSTSLHRRTPICGPGYRGARPTDQADAAADRSAATIWAPAPPTRNGALASARSRAKPARVSPIVGPQRRCLECRSLPPAGEPLSRWTRPAPGKTPRGCGKAATRSRARTAFEGKTAPCSAPRAERQRPRNPRGFVPGGRFPASFNIEGKYAVRARGSRASFICRRAVLSGPDQAGSFGRPEEDARATGFAGPIVTGSTTKSK